MKLLLKTRFCTFLIVAAISGTANASVHAGDSIATALAPDSCCAEKSIDRTTKFRPQQLIIPALLIGTGVAGLESHWLINGSHEIKDELQEDGHGNVSIDDFMQFAPMAAVYGLNLCGVKGRHGFRDRTMILATATMIMSSSVLVIKSTSNVRRPDGSSTNSFPSGHTATAFMGAEFLRREYKDVSPWIGVAGYAVAFGTGFFRMYNDRHWVNDVIAGAGIGILSTEIAYWLQPAISRALFPKKKGDRDIAILPCYSPEFKGLSCQLAF